MICMQSEKLKTTTGDVSDERTTQINKHEAKDTNC
jgi:hypothetical protein